MIPAALCIVVGLALLGIFKFAVFVIEDGERVQRRLAGLE